MRKGLAVALMALAVLGILALASPAGAELMVHTADGTVLGTLVNVEPGNDGYGSVVRIYNKQKDAVFDIETDINKYYKMTCAPGDIREPRYIVVVNSGGTDKLYLLEFAGIATRKIIRYKKKYYITARETETWKPTKLCYRTWANNDKIGWKCNAWSGDEIVMVTQLIRISKPFARLPVKLPLRFVQVP